MVLFKMILCIHIEISLTKIIIVDEISPTSTNIRK